VCATWKRQRAATVGVGVLGARSRSRPLVIRTYVLYPAVVELRRRWWNGRYGSLVRRDIYLFLDGDGWLVQAREGGADGRTRAWSPPTEAYALQLCDDLMNDQDGWIEITPKRT
jgi:hypothetical protein